MNPSQRSCYSENIEENEDGPSPLRIEPRRLVITADKPKAVFKGEMSQQKSGPMKNSVKNCSSSDIKVFISVPDGKMEMSFEELGEQQHSRAPNNQRTVRPQEIVECHLNLTPSEFEKLKTEELKDQEIQVEYLSSMPKELIRVVFSDKEEMTKKEEEAEEKNLGHLLKIEPRRLVITADKPTAMFKVKNLSTTDIKVFISVPRGNVSFEELGGSSKSEPNSSDSRVVRPQEIVECHLNLTSSDLEKLKTEGLQEIQVEYLESKDISSMPKELIRVVFSDKEDGQRSWKPSRSPIRRRSGTKSKMNGSVKNTTSSYEKSPTTPATPVNSKDSANSKEATVVAKSLMMTPTKTTSTVIQRAPKTSQVVKNPPKKPMVVVAEKKKKKQKVKQKAKNQKDQKPPKKQKSCLIM